ncbi:MAG TPA: Rrf2 family transcriptional regulator [Bacteroidales bacterium]|nr:Rrf2 family transcriptional regulator [Bacteroidales bacterium]HRZ75868.1 Rrf2 family transcriptional regulator [Bacteroidales bacterium]
MLTKTTEYAIRALIFIQARNLKGERPRLPEIAEGSNAPVHYIGKILQTLVRHRLLASAKGPGGGFFFAKNVPSISLFDVIRLMEGEAFFHRCGFGLNNCSVENPCPAHDQYREIRELYLEKVTRLTIADLAERVNEGKAYLDV